MYTCSKLCQRLLRRRCIERFDNIKITFTFLHITLFTYTYSTLKAKSKFNYVKFVSNDNKFPKISNDTSKEFSKSFNLFDDTAIKSVVNFLFSYKAFIIKIISPKVRPYLTLKDAAFRPFFDLINRTHKLVHSINKRESTR